VATSKMDSECDRGDKAKRGFSLIEVLLTTALVSFLLAGMAELVLSAVRAKSTTDGHFRRTQVLTAKLEGLKAVPFESPSLQAGAYEEEIAAVPPDPAALAEWRIEDSGPQAKKVDLRITLRDRPERSLRAVLLISKFLGF